LLVGLNNDVGAVVGENVGMATGVLAGLLVWGTLPGQTESGGRTLKSGGVCPGGTEQPPSPFTDPNGPYAPVKQEVWATVAGPTGKLDVVPNLPADSTTFVGTILRLRVGFGCR